MKKNTIPIFSRLSTKMTLLISLVSVLPLLFFGLKLIDSYRKSLLTNAVDLSLQTAERASDKIGMALTTLEGFLSSTAQQRCFRTGDVRDQISELQFLVHRDPAINSLISTDSGMNILAAVCERHVNLHRDSVYSISDEFLNSGTTGLYHGTLSISDTGERELELIIPVMNFQQTEVSGYLIAMISVHDLLADVIRIDRNENISLAVVSGAGQLIAHPDYSRVLHGENWGTNPHISHFLVDSGGVHEKAHSFTNEAGERVIGAATIVPSTGWVVYCEQKESLAFLPAEKAASELRVVLAAVLLAAVVLIVYMTSLLTKPISQLVNSAEIVGAGNLQHRTGISSRSEIGVLAAAFDGMAANLQDSTASLDDLNREKELRESQWNRIITILNNIPDVIYVVDPVTYEVIFVNQVFEDMLGESPVGKKCHKSFQNLEEPCSFCTNHIILKTREPYVWEFHNENVNRDFIITDQIIRWPDGRDLRFEIAKDITSYKESEREKEKLTQYFQAMLSNENVWIEVFDEKGDIAYWSLGAEAISGYSLKEIKNDPGIQMLAPFSRDGMQGHEPEEDDTERTFSRKITCRNGSVKTVLGVSTPLRDNSGIPTGRITVCRDITEMQKMHEAVLLQKSITDSVIESLPGLFYQISSENRFVRWNRHMARVTEQNDREMASISPLDIFPDEEKELIGSKIAGLFTNGGEDTVYANVLSKSGKKTPHLLTGSMHNIDGEEYLIGMGIDITDLKKTQRELERSNRELTQFAYVASHDLQEPLRMVASYTQLLKKNYAQKLDGDALDYIDFAVDGAQRMQKLIRDLLMFSRINTKGGDFAPVSMESVLQTALDNLQMQIEENSALITSDTLPVVMGDQSQLVQLIQNLVSNGIKFRGDETPEIHLSSVEKKDFWEISIADNGIGIDESYFDKIFVIFQRLHGRDVYPGTGIGLSLCKRIVERHGGTIRVESSVGSGSVFRFTLPKTHGSKGDNE